MEEKLLAISVSAMLFFAACKKQESVTAIAKANVTSSALVSQAILSGDIIGKVTVGYQGWFAASGDGSPVNSYNHTNLEMWPDTREYLTTYGLVPFAQGGVMNTPFAGTLGNGQPAKMFSSYDQSTVNVHFKWMQQSDIDCAALQRFANEITPGSQIKAQRDGIIQKVQLAAGTYQRKFYIMYDVSGQGDMSTLKTDWANTIKGSLNLLNSPQYAVQDGKPVVCIYGLGYLGQSTNAADALDIINWFKTQGCYVIGSIPGGWRVGANTKSDFLPVFAAFNMISGWGVGGLVGDDYTSYIAADRDLSEQHGVQYQNCIYPGTAFYNSNGSKSPKNQLPRNHGEFMWKQFAAMRQNRMSTVYIAMFDEMNEATSIFKVAEDASMVPSGEYFLTLDADGTHLSSDFYLRLVKNGGSMLKGLIPYQEKHTTPFTLSTSTSVKFFQDANYLGTASQELAIGRYTLLQLILKGFKNDAMSSLQVPLGRTITMYSDDLFKGTSWSIKSDTPDFSKLSPNADNVISSVIVQ